MGLDAYAYREITLKDKIKEVGENKEINKILADENTDTVIKTQIAYWRKFNALHDYMTTRFGGEGSDNCRRMYLSLDDWEDLARTLREILDKARLVDGWVDNGFTFYFVKPTDKIMLADDTIKTVAEIKKGDEIKAIGDNIEKGEFFPEHTIAYPYDERNGEVELKVMFFERGKVVDKKDVQFCKDNFPTAEGFFFGDTDYDEYYLDDIEDTYNTVQGIIAEHAKLIASGVDTYDINYYYYAWY